MSHCLPTPMSFCISLCTALCGLLATAAPVGAATLSGALGSDATDARLLALDCSDSGSSAPASASIRIRDLAPVNAPVVSVQIRKGFAARSSSDPTDADVDGSPLVVVDGGAGRYDVYVDKNAAGEEAFEVEAQCWTGIGGSGSPAGTALFAQTGGAVPIADGATRAALVAALILLGGCLAMRSRGSVDGRARSRLSAFAWASLALAFANDARAHGQSGSLGTPAAATDYYEVTCFDNGAGPPGSLELAIRDAAPGAIPTVNLQGHRGLSLRSVSDGILPDILPSPSIFVNEGAGSYFVLVDKSGPGAKFYELTYHCWTGPNGTGIHTGSALVTRQSE